MHCFQSEYREKRFCDIAKTFLPYIMIMRTDESGDIHGAIQVAYNLFGDDAFPNIDNNFEIGSWTFISLSFERMYLFFFKNEADAVMFMLSVDCPDKLKKMKNCDY